MSTMCSRVSRVYTTSKELSGKSTKVASQISKETCRMQGAMEEGMCGTVTAFSAQVTHVLRYVRTDTQTHRRTRVSLGLSTALSIAMLTMFTLRSMACTTAPYSSACGEGEGAGLVGDTPTTIHKENRIRSVLLSFPQGKEHARTAANFRPLKERQKIWD